MKIYTGTGRYIHVHANYDILIISNLYLQKKL